MALVKNIVNDQGVTATYHRLNGCTLRYNLDHSVTALVMLASYVDQATRLADKLPVTQTSLRLSLTDPAPAAIDQTYLYDQIKAQPEWNDATSA